MVAIFYFNEAVNQDLFIYTLEFIILELMQNRWKTIVLSRELITNYLSNIFYKIGVIYACLDKEQLDITSVEAPHALPRPSGNHF